MTSSLLAKSVMQWKSKGSLLKIGREKLQTTLLLKKKTDIVHANSPMSPTCKKWIKNFKIVDQAVKFVVNTRQIRNARV